MAKKRKAGDGLIRQRADGRWEGRYVVGYDDHGYPKTKAVFGKSKRECAEKLAALKTQLGGIPSDKLRPEMRFADWHSRQLARLDWITGMKRTASRTSAPRRSPAMKTASACTSGRSWAKFR